MSKLVLERAEEPDIAQPADYNPNVTLDTLQYDCKVQCLVFGKSDLAQELKNDLRNLGEEYGKNMYVGLWNMGDNNYDILAHEYNFQKLPCIIVTALKDLSEIEDGKYAYVKLDGRLLDPKFGSSERCTIRSFEKT